MSIAITVEELLHEGTEILHKAGIENGRQECIWLLAEEMDLPPAMLAPQLSFPIPKPMADRFREQVERRRLGEPLQYVMGSAEFHGVTVMVGPGVLAPRPETEQLVELAIAHYPGKGAICDLCTGSGAIALALGVAIPQAQVVGVELMPDALVYAQRNRESMAIGNVAFYQGDLFVGLPAGISLFSMITANPPYVTEAEYAALDPEVKDHEPITALVSGPDGLDLIRRIVTESRAHLESGGVLICEIGCEQGSAVAALFKAAGYNGVEVLHDYAGRDRFVLGCFQKESSLEKE